MRHEDFERRRLQTLGLAAYEERLEHFRYLLRATVIPHKRRRLNLKKRVAAAEQVLAAVRQKAGA